MATYQATLGRSEAPVFESTYGNTITIVSSYTTPALSAGDKIQMLTVPAGAKIVDGYVRYDALKSGTTVSVGDSGSATRFVATADASSAGSTRFSGVPHEYSSETTLEITLGTAGTDAGDTIDLVVSYIVSD